MKQLSLDHLEHAMPALRDLGLETLLPLLGGQALSAEAVGGALAGLAAGAEKRAIRRLVAVARATGEEVFAWESNPEALKRALAGAALAPIDESFQAVADFFTSLAPFLPSIRASLESGTVEKAPGEEPPSAPIPSAES